MVTSYDAPARPQHWQLHGTRASASTSWPSISPKSELCEVGEWFAKQYQEKFNEPPVYAALNGFANAFVFAQAIEKAKTTEPKAMIKALEEGSFNGWSIDARDLPAGGRRVVAQLVAAADGPAICRQGSDAGECHGGLYFGRVARAWRGAPDAGKASGAIIVRRGKAGAEARVADDLQHRASDPDLLSGLMVGVLYALMALGITFIYSIVKTINWAMGEFYMIGSYIQFVAVHFLLGPTGGGWRRSWPRPAPSCSA